VPYQSEFTPNRHATSMIARYISNMSGPQKINVTLHTPVDNQMIALSFVRLDPAVLRAFMGSMEALAATDVRQVLGALVSADLKVTVNVSDMYYSLDFARLQELYGR